MATNISHPALKNAKALVVGIANEHSIAARRMTGQTLTSTVA